MARLGLIGGASRERESLREASVRNSRLKEVIVAAVAGELAHVVDTTQMPPRDSDEIVDISTVFVENGDLYSVDPEYPYTDD